ncbi:MAG: TPM domain-containing protein [Oscillospiraceae bacterium]|nr:TPM domain-containing protein [Oscillospiraceae bacterium]
MEFFKKRSTAWTVLIVVMVAAAFIGYSRRPASEVKILPSGVYVQDNANVLSAATEQHMTYMNNDLVSKVGGEIHVVTVETTGKEDIFDKAIDLAIATNLSSNSCIFFIAVDDVDAVIVQGDDLIYDFSDNELSYILQSNFTEKDFRNKTLDSPAKASFDRLITMYENHYGIRIGGSEYISYEYTDSSSSDLVVLFVLLLILIVIVSSRATRPRRYRTRSRTVIVPGPTVYTGRVHTPPPHRPGGTARPSGGSFSSSRTGGFGSSSRGGSFSSGSSRGGSFSSHSSFGGSRSGGFGGGSRGGSFGGGSRGGGFRK